MKLLQVLKELSLSVEITIYLFVWNRSRSGEAGASDLCVQLDVFEEQRESDECQHLGQDGLDLNSHLDIFYAILRMVSETPQEANFLGILQHLLRLDPRGDAGGGAGLAWETAETLVHRASLIEGADDASRLLHRPPPAPACCNCLRGESKAKA
ncbi:hypothetical protein J437_LFUL008463, partial [Ladona fulva]